MHELCSMHGIWKRKTVTGEYGRFKVWKKKLNGTDQWRRIPTIFWWYMVFLWWAGLTRGGAAIIVIEKLATKARVAEWVSAVEIFSLRCWQDKSRAWNRTTCSITMSNGTKAAIPEKAKDFRTKPEIPSTFISLHKDSLFTTPLLSWRIKRVTMRNLVQTLEWVTYKLVEVYVQWNVDIGLTGCWKRKQDLSHDASM